MNESRIVFSPRAKQRLENITDYLLTETQSLDFVVQYIDLLEEYLTNVLITFPESGARVPAYGENVRKAVYKEYSFVYQIKGSNIEILTIYRENLP